MDRIHIFVKKRIFVTCICAIAVGIFIGQLFPFPWSATNKLNHYKETIIFSVESSQDDLYFHIDAYLRSDGYASNLLEEIRDDCLTIMSSLNRTFETSLFFKEDLDFHTRNDLIGLYGCLYSVAYDLQLISMNGKNLINTTILSSNSFQKLYEIQNVIFPNGPEKLDGVLENLQSDEGQALVQELRELGKIDLE